MNKSLLAATTLLAAPLSGASGQQPYRPVVMMQHGLAPADSNPIPAQPLTKFSIDFPGGPPSLLVSTIEKATGKPLNAIIPREDEQIDLPPMKMNNVDVARLFAALESSSHSQQAVLNGTGGFAYHNNEYSFITDKESLSDDSIWAFHADMAAKPPPPKDDSKFYNLAPFLDRGFTVDDIITAIRTAWDMQDKGGDSPPEPKISFHKETKLLIAVGDPGKLTMIDQALNALPATSVSENDIDKMKASIAALQQKVQNLNNRLDNPAGNGGGEHRSPGGPLPPPSH
jgi:hypothetical protein